jgi:hypothetical protein
MQWSKAETRLFKHFVPDFEPSRFKDVYLTYMSMVWNAFKEELPYRTTHDPYHEALRSCVKALDNIGSPQWALEVEHGCALGRETPQWDAMITEWIGEE